jgi:cytochrome c oxidase subunit 2
MNLFQKLGAESQSVTPLTWALLIVSIVVVVIITGVVVMGLRRGRGEDLATLRAGSSSVSRPPGAIVWIYIGLGLTTVTLLGALLWSMVVLADVSPPPREAGLTIDITGHQWWWGVRYDSAAPSQVFSTANEIHIPTGVPVRLRLRSVDVIHSFWVPALAGKTDLIPGQINEAWLEAKKAGTYWGQCGEFCGAQHAHMAFLVVAQSPQDFNAWREAQLKPSPPPVDTAALNGSRYFVQRCGSCHTVRGTGAGGVLGPDLTHIGQRHGLAAETLPNTPGHLAAWIADPQTFKPGNQMPVLGLPGPELTQIRAYVETLK